MSARLDHLGGELRGRGRRDRVHPLREERPERDDSHLMVQLVVGLRHLVADRVLANMLVGFGLTMLVLGFCEASIYALLDAFEKPATYAGVFVTIQGVGRSWAGRPQAG